jgi:hypothetical protein
MMQIAMKTAFEAKTLITISFYTGSATYYSGSCLITERTPSADAKGLTKISYKLQGSGALSYT